MHPPRLPLLLPLSLSLAVLVDAQRLPSLNEIQKWTKQCENRIDAGQYAAALPACQKAVEALERLETEQPKLAEALNDLGMLYQRQGEYLKAEPLHLRSLRIREQALGLEHIDVAESLNNLAELYSITGQYPNVE